MTATAEEAPLLGDFLKSVDQLTYLPTHPHHTVLYRVGIKYFWRGGVGTRSY